MVFEKQKEFSTEVFLKEIKEEGIDLTEEIWIFFLKVLKNSLENDNIEFRIRNVLSNFERILNIYEFFNIKIYLYLGEEIEKDTKLQTYVFKISNEKHINARKNIVSDQENVVKMRYWPVTKKIELDFIVNKQAYIKLVLDDIELDLTQTKDEEILEKIFWISYAYVLFVFEPIVEAHYFWLRSEEAFKKDSLVKNIYNRKALEEEIIKLEKSKDKIQKTIIIFDLNNFKKYNDTYGHLAGDKALIAFGKVLEKHFRKEDFIARYGGDEFVAIIDKISEKSLKDKIKKIRSDYKKYFEDKKIKVDFAVGWSHWPKKGKSIKEILKESDKKMYENKKLIKRKLKIIEV